MNKAYESERQKWDSIYSILDEPESLEVIQSFNHEFRNKINDLLPFEGKVLEAGCGAGWQSLALALDGRYDVHLLDFSSKAIEYSKKIFLNHNSSAQWHTGNVSTQGQPEYDLVFNAGVLEHYNLQQQIELLRGMASRSKKYVLVLVPNVYCYWYWLWRVHYASKMDWPFGKEIPVATLSNHFKLAGINYLGQCYLGNSWTESFIQGIDGIDEQIKENIVAIHRAGIIRPEQTAYLVAVLGSVNNDDFVVNGWETNEVKDDITYPTLATALADSLSINLHNNRSLSQNQKSYDHLTDQVDQSLVITHQILESLSEFNSIFDEFELRTKEKDQVIAELDAQIHADQIEFERRMIEKDQEIVKLNDQINITQTEIQNLTLALAEKHETLSHVETSRAYYQNQLDEIYRSRAWRLVKVIWIISVELRKLSRKRSISRRDNRGYTTISNDIVNTISNKPQVTPKNSRSIEEIQKIIDLSGDKENRVWIVSAQYLDNFGNNLYLGGAERYIIELAKIIRDIGYDPQVLQCGKSNWVRYVGNLKVVGIDGEGDSNIFNNLLPQLDLKCKLTILSPFSIATSRLSVPTIGISHGIYWDHPAYQNSILTTTQAILLSVELIDKLISVDSNTINWVRSLSYYDAEKIQYIPNFVDTTQFKPQKKNTNNKVVILFPRRLFEARGLYLVIKVAPEILDKFPQTEFHFVGQGGTTDQAKVDELKSRYPNRVKCYNLPMNRMMEAYQWAEITLIPTLSGEGTSLSCLEALASGNAVISTYVGGLPDIIINRYNGLLIEPTTDALKNALVELVENQELRSLISHNGVKVAESFSLARWKKQWSEVLNQFLTYRDHGKPIPYVKSIIFPYSWGVSWEGVKQRPHHIAAELAKQGYEVYWHSPEGRIPDPHPNIHILNHNDSLHISRPVLFIYYPQSYEDIYKYDNPIVVYDVLDDISIHDVPDNSEAGKLARKYHELLINKADIVLASSNLLLNQIKKRRPDVLYVPNAVDLNHFNPENITPDKKLANIKHPIIGYHGAVAYWFDGNLMAEVAKLRPQYQFVLIGPISDDKVRQALDSQKNILCLGIIPYEALPSYLIHFDVGIMPFIISDLTNAVRPLKVLEYFSLQKPVVATPLTELLDWPEIYLAKGSEEFAKSIDLALGNSHKIKESADVKNMLVNSTWDVVTHPLTELLDRMWGMHEV